MNHAISAFNETVASVLFWNIAGDTFQAPVFEDGVAVRHPDGSPQMKTVAVPFVVTLLGAGGVFFTLAYRFVNLRGFRHAIAIVRGKYDGEQAEGEISHFRALTSALSATVGLGNIAGVAIAIKLGGPGAMFWMWIAAFFGMSTKFSSCTLAQIFRRKNPDGSVSGGPMYYLDLAFRQRGPLWSKFGKALAVMYAFMFTLVFFALYYRMFGLLTCMALMLNLLMVVAVMSLFGATMTLPGFAGLALSIGMSVDANVLINERIREELRAGLPPRSAIATGYDKASGTIFDSNMTALLAGIALYAFGTGPLRGFAVTMVIGILTSVFTAVTVSRGVATLIYGGRRKLKSIAI